MKPLLIAAAIGSAAMFAPVQAEAARCTKGKIYRPSQGVCVSKQAAIRAGVYRPRVAKKAPPKRARKPPVERAHNYPPPTPPWMQRTPIVDGLPPEKIAIGPFGALLPMPESTQSRLVRWAAQNLEGEQ